jgi:formate dehydrogenase assembly factor FdhD
VQIERMQAAPRDPAIEAADRLGMPVVSVLRGDGLNVYSHDGRIELPTC